LHKASAQVRSFRLHLRTGHTLTELAHAINPIVRGWAERLTPGSVGAGGATPPATRPGNSNLGDVARIDKSAGTVARYAREAGGRVAAGLLASPTCGVVQGVKWPPKMSELPNVDGQTALGAGLAMGLPSASD
jgi:Group II intron, maturase-specific domain